MNYVLLFQLHGEITETCDSDDVTPEQVNQLKLLDYCINETMRLYPQGFRYVFKGYAQCFTP